MRLICPSCQSEYEIDGAAIGETGRMVRCANCGGEWFQAPESDNSLDGVVDDLAAAARPQFEAHTDQAEAEVEAQAAQSEDRGYRIIDETPATSVTYDDAPEIERSFPAGEEEDFAPNRYSEARDTDALTASLHDEADIRPASGRSGSSFLGGFATSVVLVGLLAAVYVATPAIISAVPALEPALASYAGVVDQGRTVLSVLIGG